MRISYCMTMVSASRFVPETARSQHAPSTPRAGLPVPYRSPPKPGHNDSSTVSSNKLAAPPAPHPLAPRGLHSNPPAPPRTPNPHPFLRSFYPATSLGLSAALPYRDQVAHCVWPPSLLWINPPESLPSYTHTSVVASYIQALHSVQIRCYKPPLQPTPSPQTALPLSIRSYVQPFGQACHTCI